MVQSSQKQQLQRSYRETPRGGAHVGKLLLMLLAVVALASTVESTVAPPRGPQVSKAQPQRDNVGLDAGVSYPTSAVYDRDTDALIVGSYADGSVRRVPLSHRQRAASLPPLPQDGRERVYRIRLDAARGKVWVLASDALYVYASETSGLLGRIPIDELAQHSSDHCLPDMAIDGSGNVVVSSALQPRLMHVDGDTLQVTHRVLQADAAAGMDFGFSALAFAADGTSLYAASATIGTVWRIDYERNTAHKLELSQRLFGACALHADASAQQVGATAKPVLYVAGGFRNGINRIDLSGGPPHQVRAVSAKGAIAVPTDFVTIDRELLIVNSRLSEHSDFEGYGSPSSRFSILRLQAP
jgi:hypothetical protein